MLNSTLLALNEEWFQPLEGLKNLSNLKDIKLITDPGQEFETTFNDFKTSPLLKYFQRLDVSIGIERFGLEESLPEDPVLGLETFIKRVQAYQRLLPSAHPVMAFLPDELLAHVTDEHLLSLKPKKFRPIGLSFSKMSKITNEGLLKFLEGASDLKNLSLEGCFLINEETINYLHKKYPGVNIER